VSVRDVVTWVLVGLGVGAQVFVCLGVLLMRDALDRLHYASAAPLGVLGVCAGVIVAAGPSVIGLKAILTAAFLAVTGPVLTHATARAIHLHRAARE
jgi:multicomponent Na+:H+ antiporter subunit G